MEFMMRAYQGLGRASIKTDLEELKATESRGVEARPEDRTRDRRQALRSSGRPKKRSQGYGGSRQKLAAASGRLNRRAVPALRKGRSRRGYGKTPGNDIGGRSKRQELRLGNKEAFYEFLGQTL
jgi:hypothetical protein